MSSKQERLEKLDGLVLDRMIDYIEKGKIELLSELTTAVQYLKANQVVETKKPNGSDPVEARKQKLKEVKERREQV